MQPADQSQLNQHQEKQLNRCGAGHRPPRAWRSARVAAVAVTLMAGAALAAAPQRTPTAASATFPSARSRRMPLPRSFLTYWCPSRPGSPLQQSASREAGHQSGHLGVPPLRSLPGRVRGPNGDLYLNGDQGHGDTTLPMMNGTSPSMTVTSNGNFEVAFQGANGDLWTDTPNNGARDWGPLGAKLGIRAAARASRRSPTA